MDRCNNLESFRHFYTKSTSGWCDSKKLTAWNRIVSFPFLFFVDSFYPLHGMNYLCASFFVVPKNGKRWWKMRTVSRGKIENCGITFFFLLRFPLAMWIYWFEKLLFAGYPWYIFVCSFLHFLLRFSIILKWIS